eukprot:XP_011666938.1 PREDICTED: uncharacterized protein LOC100888965 [Strongylocentrotus purpuratus]
MEDTQAFLKKLSNKMWIKKFLQKKTICDKFDGLYNRLLTFGQSLIISLQTEFSSYISVDMVKQWEANFSALKLLQDDVKDLKQDSKSLAENVEQLTKFMVSKLKFLQQLKTPTENEGHIKYTDFSYIVKLHDGKYGPIYKAKHQGWEDRMLVFKTFEDNGLSARKELKEQCGMWMKLNYSRFIVQLYGYTISDDGCMCFVVEYMPLGTLRSVLLDEANHQLTWEQRRRLPGTALRGLCAIHVAKERQCYIGQSLLLDSCWMRTTKLRSPIMVL